MKKLQIVNHATKIYFYSDTVPNSVRDMSISAKTYHLPESYLKEQGYSKRDDRLMIQMGKLNQLQ